MLRMKEYLTDDRIDETNSKSPSQASIGLKEVFLTPSSTIHAGRKVSFAPLMHLVIVPCLRDYRQANLMDIMWYKASDFYEFQQASHEEIRQMAAYDSSSHSDARRKLYQPSGDELALPQHFETSPVVTDKLEQLQDEDVIDVVSSFAQPLALRTMHRSVSFDNLARLKSQRAEATSASRTTVAGASKTSNIGSRIRSQSLNPPVLTESCVRRIFRNNSMDKLKAQALSRGKTTTTTVSEVQQHLPLENSVAVDDDLLCVPGPDVELRDAPTPKCSNNNRSFFGILSKAVDRDVLTRVVAWTSALTIAVLLASATTPGVGHGHL